MGKTASLPKANPKITYSAAFFLRQLMRRFTVNTLDDMDNLKERIAPIEKAISEFQEKYPGGPESAPIQSDLMRESTVGKNEIAYLTKAELGQIIAGKGLEMEAIEMLLFWLVKD